MYRNKSLTIIVVLLLIVSLVGGLSACQKKEPVKKKTPAEIALENAYERQYDAISAGDFHTFTKISPPTENLNQDGIIVSIYTGLAGYHKETDKILTYQQVMDYFSQKYESDGTLRIYNNGRHPEIEAYVNWASNHQDVLSEYDYNLYSLYIDYSQANPSFKVVDRKQWSTAIVDELIKKEADPNYQMNLLAIQQQEAAQTTTTPSP